MISLDDVLAYRKERFEKSLALVKTKGADYCRDQQASGDSLFNMRVAEILGIVPNTETGILVRLSDKFMRIISLAKDPGREAAIPQEKLEETVDDFHNYLDYILLFRKERMEKVRSAQ